MDIYRFDGTFRDKGYSLIAGVDEAGRGPIAGPVVASAVILPEHVRIDGLRDSKKVPEPEREHLFYEVLCSASYIGVGVVDVSQIEQLNILGATKLAMKTAIKDLDVRPDLLIIDAVNLDGIDVPQESPIKGDSKSASVAAASIIAKYFRDKLMMHYHEMYPEYGFDRHKGYGTMEHMTVIQKIGPCPQHRKAFRGVMELTLPF